MVIKRIWTYICYNVYNTSILVMVKENCKVIAYGCGLKVNEVGMNAMRDLRLNLNKANAMVFFPICVMCW